MVITGFILVGHDPNLLRQHWLHAKLLLVVILIALDLRVTFRARAFQEGTAEVTRGEGCMALHGAIALVFTAILILVLVKPFSPHPPHAEAGKTISGQNVLSGWRKAASRVQLSIGSTGQS